MGFLDKLLGRNASAHTDLSAIVNDPDTLLVDVRTPEEFKSGSVKGAINIPLDTIMSQADRFNKHHKVVVFCRSGNRSARARQILQQKGIKQVINGGTWQQVAQYKS